MTNIYTRDFSRGRRENIRYSPPPGYDGVAFDDSESTKLHEAETDISELSRDSIRQKNGIRDEGDVEHVYDKSEAEEKAAPIAEVPRGDAVRRDSGTVEELFKSLRGKIGTEELILILVILVVASEGIGIEALILGLLLIAG